MGLSATTVCLARSPCPCTEPSLGDGPTFHIPVHDDVSDHTGVELQVNLDHCSPNDAVSVTLDGELLGEPTLHRTGGEGHLSEDTWLVWKLRPAQAERGIHEVRLVLDRRDPRLGVPVVVENVELHITYAN